MNTWFIGKITKLSRVEDNNKTHKDSKAEFVSQRYEGTQRGYNESEIKICFGTNGSVSFSDEHAESFIYLYPEQVKHLKRLLDIKNYRNQRGVLEHIQKVRKK